MFKLRNNHVRMSYLPSFAGEENDPPRGSSCPVHIAIEWPGSQLPPERRALPSPPIPVGVETGSGGSMREDWAALAFCTTVALPPRGDECPPAGPPLSPWAPSSSPTAQTLFTTRKFSMVFPLAKTTSPVSFTASGRISFTSWAMTPGEGHAKCGEGVCPNTVN